MRMANVWFGPATKLIYGTAVKSYVALLLDRVMPIFDDIDGEQQRAADEAYQAYGQWSDGSDIESAAEAAYEYGNEQALMFMEMRTVFLATGVSGLFHLFEKQLYLHFNHDLNDWLEKPISQWRDIEQVVALLTDSLHTGRTLQAAFSDPDLVELRHVANAVKHGDDGSAMKALKAMNAVVVHRSRLDEDWTVGAFSVLGVNIGVQKEDVLRYRDAVLRFWTLDGTFSVPS